MADKHDRDREADRVSRDHESRRKEAVEAIATKNAEVQRAARKVREASDRRKAAMRRSADD
jgi:hypothetical protein